MTTMTPNDLLRWINHMPEKDRDLPIYVSDTCWPSFKERKAILMTGLFGSKGVSMHLLIIE